MAWVLFVCAIVLVWLAGRTWRRREGVTPAVRWTKLFAQSAGALFLAVAGLILLIPTPEPVASSTAAPPSVAAAGPISSPPPPAVPPEIGFDWEAVRGAMRKDFPDAMTAFFDKGLGEVEIEENTRRKTTVVIWLAKRTDGNAARDLAETFAKYILKDRVARGQKPRDEYQSLFIHVQSKDAPLSVTGNKQVVYFGRVMYDYNKDRLEWDSKI